MGLNTAVGYMPMGGQFAGAGMVTVRPPHPYRLTAVQSIISLGLHLGAIDHAKDLSAED